ncbi:AGAP007854-PA-like protein [Anopheles sinensis]|uniref:Dipeptidase n=1 Tax=Anopheles sinensis TaxID=74873 RepID=A0A084W3P9_ANOSI|nr:AGAP007854-PA-like protein [Anopheles sinensis]
MAHFILHFWHETRLYLSVLLKAVTDHLTSFHKSCLFFILGSPSHPNHHDDRDSTPKDLEDVSSYPRLFAELLGEGWTIDELEKLAGRNLLRVFEDVEKVRDKQRLVEVRPFEDIPPVVRPEEHMNCTTNS